MVDDVVRRWAPVYPHLRYEEPGEAIAWLSRVFGFRERVRMARPDGGIIVAKLESPGGGLVMVAGRSPDFQQWIRERVPDFREQPGRPWPHLSHTTTVLVSDVDAHHHRATNQGATILMAPTDRPGACARTQPSTWKGTSGSSANCCASWSRRRGARLGLNSRITRRSKTHSKSPGV